MFNRKEIKANAKTVLKRSYWMGFLVSLLAAIATGGIGGGGSVGGGNGGGGVVTSSTDLQNIGQMANGSIDQAQMQQIQDYLSKNAPLIIGIIGAVMAGVIVFSLAWSFFVASPAKIGLSRFFVATREQTNPVDFSYALYGFKYNYLKKAWAYFSTQLIIALYSLLWSVIALIPVAIGLFLTIKNDNPAWMLLSLLELPCMIPVIIKTLQYRMVPYILANNGEINGKRARELSKSMTDGNKWNLFVLDLSFLGWLILGSLACGVGILFVLPYINAAEAEAYTCLKAEAMQTKGLSGDEELPSLVGASV